MSLNSSIHTDEDSVFSSETDSSRMSTIDSTKLEHIQNKEKLVQDNMQNIYDPDCVRKKSNWSKSSNVYKFDHPDFSPEKLFKDIPSHSSKLHALLKKISDLDKKDMEKDGRMYKHFIFSDIKSGTYGAKLVASALLSSGMKLAYEAPMKNAKESELLTSSQSAGAKQKTYGKIELLEDDVLLKNKNNNFFLLSSVSVYDQPISVALKKSILKKFNQRPENVHGELARIIVMDSGYKEGIDLFDIKYVHIYEPPTTMADQKQVIGRGTRTCGQKGLEFHPTQGWPLHVFIYDVEIPQEMQSQMLGSPTLFDLYLKAMNIDLRLFNFQHDLERATVYGSVDYELNKSIHNFSVQPDANDVMLGGSGPKRIVIREDLPVLNLPAQIEELVFTERETNAKPMGFEEMRKHIRKHFHRFQWADVKMENNCVEKTTKTGGAEIIQYSPTQDFLRHYFVPENPIKGMLLYNSVGTGKTCSAIAAASHSFERKGYTILWVTRTTLKNDIWKNMFDQVCSETIRDKIEEGLEIPDENAKRMRLLSKSWSIRPMSYKQFSNLVSKKNNLYKALVKKNGEADPLNKTLLIIDEAHKLYGGEDLSSIERPDMDALEKALQNSYQLSGNDSVKLLLMTATPITDNPMELVKLINLTKTQQYQLPNHFDDFSTKFLDEHGRFTEKGEAEYLDAIAGHVSYLNREKDARQFSQPIVRFVKTPLVNVKDAMMFDKKYVRQYIDSDIGKIKKEIAKTNAEIDAEIKEVNADKFGFLLEKCANYEGKAEKMCVKVVKANIRDIVKDAKWYIKDYKNSIKDLKNKIKEKKGLKKKMIQAVQLNIWDKEEEYANFKETIYYNLKKCGKKINNMSELKEAIKDYPSIVSYDDQLREIDEKIVELQTKLKNNLDTYKNRIKKMREVLKTDLSELESNVVRMVIKDERKTVKKREKEMTKEKDETIATYNKTKKHLERQRVKKIRQIRNTLKQQIKEDKKVENETKRVEKELRKTQRKQGLLVETIENELLKDLVDNYSKMIDDELELLQEDIQQQEREQAEKQEQKLTEKAQKLAEKEKQKQEREQQKTEKKQHRETQKIQKALLKQEEKAEKKRVKMEEREAKRANTTRKNKK